MSQCYKLCLLTLVLMGADCYWKPSWIQISTAQDMSCNVMWSSHCLGIMSFTRCGHLVCGFNLMEDQKSFLRNCWQMIWKFKRISLEFWWQTGKPRLSFLSWCRLLLTEDTFYTAHSFPRPDRFCWRHASILFCYTCIIAIYSTVCFPFL